MKRSLGLLLIVGLLVMTSPKQAQAEENIAWDHMGTSFMLNTVMYGIGKQAFHLTTQDAFIFSAFTTLAAGFVYEYMSAFDQGANHIDGNKLIWNAVGTGLSVGTCLMFKF